MSYETNIKLLLTAHDLLGELVNDVVFVGGITTCLYVDHEVAEPLRPTLDVDCVLEVISKKHYDEFQNKLRSKGFKHDMRPGAPICRFTYGDLLILDVMPDDPSVLGFSNSWYKQGITSRQISKVKNKEFYIFPLPLFIASKFEAHLGRGQRDPRMSWDLEDIVLVIDGIKDFNLNVPPSSLKNFLKEMSEYFKRAEIEEAAAAFLRNDPEKIQRLKKRIYGI